MYSEDVIDSADAQGKFRLRVLASLHVFMLGPDDVCFFTKSWSAMQRRGPTAVYEAGKKPVFFC